MPTALEILQPVNPFAYGLLDATRASSPVFQALAAMEMTGTKYTTIATAALPVAGGFVRMDEGATISRGRMELQEVEAYRIAAALYEPKASLDMFNHVNAAAISAGQILNYQTSVITGRIRAEMELLEQQIIQGTAPGGIAQYGFTGLRQSINASLATNVYTRSMSPNVDKYIRSALNAGGTTSNTGSRVYVFANNTNNGVSLRLGGPQGAAGFMQFGQIVEQLDRYNDGVVDRIAPFYKGMAEGYVGLDIFGSSMGSDRTVPQRVLRMAFNVTADSGATCSESLLDDLLNTMPRESRNNSPLIVMSLRSLRQLAASKMSSSINIMLSPGDAASNTFSGSIELPESHRGIPILVSDYIADNDAIITPA